jgi:putative DNA primase/helicase
LYGLDRLAARLGAPVLICEGEKAADAATVLCPHHVAVTWIGGTAAVGYADWTPLAGRDVLVWPDADEPGLKAGKEVAKHAREAVAASVRTLAPPPGAPRGWDAADSLADGLGEVAGVGWDTARVESWWLENRVGPPHVARAPETVAAAYEPSSPLEPDVDLKINSHDFPFQILGYNRESFYYIPSDGGMVIHISGAGHSKAALMMLAPLHFWEGPPWNCEGRPSWDAAANALIREGYRMGVYDPWRIRGRGAWWDAGRVVVHLGNRMLIDGAPCPPRAIDSEFIYEQGPPIKMGGAGALQASEASKLLDLCKMLSWQRPISAYYLAAWCALAPVCAALTWRPNLFLTGPSGAGKTWVYENIIVRAVGNAGLKFAASTTEPSIRRALGADGLPCMIDEFEARDAQAKTRLDAIAALMRYCSQPSSSKIIKAAPGGGIDIFSPQSMFATTAIASQLTDYADLTRQSTCALKQVRGSAGAERFAALQAAQRALMTDAWIDGLHARMIALIPTIRHNAEVFAVAAARAFGTRRLGDQIGTLLAGVFALTSSKKVEAKAAEEWIAKQDWDEENEIVQDTDGLSCFARIMEHVILVDSPRGTVRRSIGELVAIANGKEDDHVERRHAAATLMRCGARATEDGYVAISNTHSAIAAILRDTPWSANWRDRLKSILGAMPSDGAVSFTDGVVTRAMLVPTAS